MGRPRKSNHLRVLHKEVPRVSQSGQAFLDNPTAPRHLDGRHARALWRQIVVAINQDRTGHLQPVDAVALELLCRDYQLYRDVDAAIKEEGPKIEARSSADRVRAAFVKNPLLATRRELAGAVREGLKQLGLTPLTRSQVDLPDPRLFDNDELAERLLS